MLSQTPVFVTAAKLAPSPGEVGPQCSAFLRWLAAFDLRDGRGMRRAAHQLRRFGFEVRALQIQPEDRELDDQSRVVPFILANVALEDSDSMSLCLAIQQLRREGIELIAAGVYPTPTE